MKLLTVTLGIAVAVSFVWIQRSRDAAEPKLFTLKVLDQYIKYYCPNSGTCTRKNALRRMKRDWPHIYRLGFDQFNAYVE